MVSSAPVIPALKTLLLMNALVLTSGTGMFAANAESLPPAADAGPVRPSPLEFAGRIALGSEQFFILYDASAKLTSPWLKLGQGWRGRALKSFDPKTERLTLTTGLVETVLALRTAKAEPVFAPSLTRGASTLQNGVLLYSADAQLTLGNGLVVSSPNGTMISDASQQTIGGDLQITLPNGTVSVENGAITVQGGKVSLTGDVFRMKVGGATASGKRLELQPEPREKAPTAETR